MNRRDQIRLSDAQDVVAALQIARMIGELGAAKGLFVELVRLDHGTHGTIENHHPSVEDGSKSLV
jgi:hypothetical protein